MTSQSLLQSLASCDAPTLAKVLAGAFIIGTLVFARSRRRSSLPLPPGPTPKLLLGNLLDLPPANSAPWLKWSEWVQTYGDVIHLEVLGQHILILSSPEACEELLVKRGGIYSDRPVFTMANLSGWSTTIGMISHDDTFRAMRRMYTPLTSPSQVLSFLPLVERPTREFLRRISASTDGATVIEHLRWLTGAYILKIIFGYTTKDKNDPFIHNADVAMKNFSMSTSPGWLVDVIPSLRHLPSWMPGASFLRQAAAWKKETDTMYDEPFDLVRRQMATGDHPSQSMISKPLEESPDDWMLGVIKYGMGAIYAGGSDTTVSAQGTFFLAMTLHPDIQRRAQAELDSVTSGSRLPTYEDRHNLPYINAIVKEVLRWSPAVPGGVPHACRTEDVYRGWRIPAGTMILANIWYLSHDANRYTNPSSFDPDRFLGPNPAPDPALASFGFGRRVCPGRHLADMSLFLTVANTLAAFDIRRKVDQDGAEIVPEVRFSGETISHPLPFPFKVTPRSEKALALLKSAT